MNVMQRYRYIYKIQEAEVLFSKPFKNLKMLLHLLSWNFQKLETGKLRLYSNSSTISWVIAYKTIQVCLNRVGKKVNAIVFMYSTLIVVVHEIEKGRKTMNFLPIFISFEFNDFHDYKVLINSFTVYVYSNT